MDLPCPIEPPLNRSFIVVIFYHYLCNRDLSERWVTRTEQTAYDFQLYSNELSVLAGEGQTVSAWSSHKGDGWSKVM